MDDTGGVQGMPGQARGGGLGDVVVSSMQEGYHIAEELRRQDGHKRRVEPHGEMWRVTLDGATPFGLCRNGMTCAD
jgi:hypothetical protein